MEAAATGEVSYPQAGEAEQIVTSRAGDVSKKWYLSPHPENIPKGHNLWVLNPAQK